MKINRFLSWLLVLALVFSLLPTIALADSTLVDGETVDENGTVVGTEAVATDPEADSTLTIEEAIALGASKEHNVYTEGKYYVTGVISEVYNTTYGNMKIMDEAGNILTIYGTYDADGINRYDAMEVKPVAGDTVTIYGIIGQYNGTAQLKNGWIVAHTPAEGGDVEEPEEPEVPADPEADSTLTVEEALALGASKEHNVYTEGKYYVTGVISEVYNTTYGNMKIMDEAGNILTIYGTFNADGTNRYDAMEVKPVAGDTVTIYGIIGQYNGTAQLKNGWIVDVIFHDHVDENYDHICDGCSLLLTECVDEDNDNYCDVCGETICLHEHVEAFVCTECGALLIPDADTELSVQEAIDLGAAHAHNTYTAGKYYVTGVISEVYNTTYGNMYITDGNGNTLTIYGTYDADGTNRYDAMEVKPIAGDTVTIYGIIGQYNGTAQLKNGWIVAHTPAEGGDVEEPEEPEVPAEPVNITTGTYVLIDTNGNAPLYVDGTWILAAQPTVVDGVVTDTCGAVWTITVTEGGVIITDANGVSIAPKGGNNNGIISGEYVWSVVDNGDGTVSFCGQGEDTVTMASNASSENKYRAYKNATVAGNPAGYSIAFVLYAVEVDTGEEPEEPEVPEVPEVPEEPEVPADPEADSTLTVEEALALGASKEHNVYTEGKYYVTGVISEVYNTTYGNMKIMDEAGNILTIYGTYDADGTNRYDAMEVKPVAGDTVTIYGIIGQYNGTAQLKNGWIVAHTPAEGGDVEEPEEPEVPADPEADSTLTIEEALALGTSKEHNVYTEGKYYVTGVISEVYNTTYGNMKIMDEAGNILTIYGTFNADGTSRYDAMEVKPVAGDTVTIYGIIGQYSGTAQLKNGWIVAHTPAEGGDVEEPEEPEVPADPEADSTLTIEEAIALGASKEHNVYTEGKYYVTGVISEVYNTTYGNMKIMDEAGNILTIYGTFNADGTSRYDAMEVKPVAGDTVTIYGIIGQYSGTAQLKNGWIVAHTPAEGGDVEEPEEPEVPADPEADSTLTIEEAIALGASKEHNVYTEGKYYVTGVISEVYNTTYGNMKIMDEAGNILTIYGTFNADGTSRYDAMEVKPVAGDTVTIYGIIGQYGGTPQLKNGWIVDVIFHDHVDENYDHICDGCSLLLTECVDEDNDNYCDVCGETICLHEHVEAFVCTECGALLIPDADTELSIQEAIDLGAAHAHNTYTAGKYYVTGLILEVYNTTYGNMRIVDENGNVLTIYGSYNADGTVRYDGLETKPVVGDTVTLYGIIGQYGGTSQMKNGWIIERSAHACSDANYDHMCDACGDVVSECYDVDGDRDHNCDICGEVLSDCVWQDFVTEPTCTEQGFITAWCPECYAHHDYDFVDPLGHDYVDGVCQNCGHQLLEVLEQPADVTASIGETVTFSVSVSGEKLTYQWQWRKNDTAAWANTTVTGNKTDTISVPVTAARNGYQYRCAITDANGNVIYSEAATLTVAAGLEILEQPADVTAAIGDKAIFCVSASGEGLSYQWQWLNAAGNWVTTSVSGNKTDTITVPVTAARNGYQYRCKITDAYGKILYSDAVTLTVAAALEILEQPTDVTAAIGQTVTFTVGASGEGLRYQWQWRKNASSVWASTTVSGNKTDTITVPVTAARNGYQYRCVITDVNGNVVYSDAATLLAAASLEILEHPTDVIANIGQTATFSVTASGDGLRYQWQWRKSDTAVWASTTVSGNKTDTITVPVTAARNGYQYRCKITDANGNVVYTDGATLTAVAGLEILEQPADVTAAIGEKVTISVSASGEGLTYQWQWRKSNTASWASTTVSGNKTDTITVPVTAARNGYQYRCVITDANGNVVYSEAATLTVATALEILEQPIDVTAAIGENVTFSVSAAGDGLTYQWQWLNSAGNWVTTSVTGNKTDTISVAATAARNGYQYRCKITDANGNVVYSDAVVLTVN